MSHPPLGKPEETAKTGKGRFSSTQIIEILAEHDTGVTVSELCRRYSISPTTFYKWRTKFTSPVRSEPGSPEQRRVAVLEDENRRLKQVLGEAVLENSVLKDKLAKKGN